MSLLNYFFVFNHLLNKKTIIYSEYFERDLLKNKNKDLAVTINRDYAIEFSGKFEFVEENSWIYTSPAGEKCPLTLSKNEFTEDEISISIYLFTPSENSVIE